MKKNRYFAAFTAGMQFIVKDVLEKQIDDINICQLLDGAVLFDTCITYDKLNMYCYNNIFSVITFTEKIKDIEIFIQRIVSDKLYNEIISNNTKKYKTFRVIISSENQLISINDSLKVKLENLIASQSKLKLNRSNSDTEFWVLYRTEGFCYFLKRLSKYTAYEKNLNKGELQPEIAFLMNWLSEPYKNDIILDPFCGNGSIPLKRALHFPTKQIFAFDYDNVMINIVKNKISKRRSLSNMKNIIIKKIDIKFLDKELSEESIDKIVSDPPWGLFKNINMDIEEFYNMTLLKMVKVLKNKGIIVLLISRNIEIEKLIEKIPILSLEQNYKVLVSGKKANLVKIKKNVPV
jgi:tRNA G10  N-methylase Trm11